MHEHRLLQESLWASRTISVITIFSMCCCHDKFLPGACFAGESVAKYIREPSPFNTQIVSLGVDTYLKMLLADNFVHTDLHPGNIMVRIRGVSHQLHARPESSLFLLPPPSSFSTSSFFFLLLLFASFFPPPPSSSSSFFTVGHHCCH